MQHVEIMASVAGLLAGMLAGVAWGVVTRATGGGDFWGRLAKVSRALLSIDEQSGGHDSFLRHYFSLFPLLGRYLLSRLLGVIVLALLLAGGLALLNPWASRVANQEAYAISLRAPGPAVLIAGETTVTVSGSTDLLPLEGLSRDSDVRLSAGGTSFVGGPLTLKQAYSPRVALRWLLTSLGFSAMKPQQTGAGPVPTVLLRLYSDEANLLWPYLADWEFDYLLLATLGSVVALMACRPGRRA